jgi:CRISPR-associated endoribonuclease Cas6
MRIIIKTTKNNEVIPFNYQPLLVGCIHKWLGNNNAQHGSTPLHSFSWIKGTTKVKGGLSISSTGSLFISAHSEQTIKKIIEGIQHTPDMFCGMVVRELIIKNTPNFNLKERFELGSPIYLKNREDGQFVFFDNTLSNEMLTKSLERKLELAGLDAANVKVYFDKEYQNPKVKGINYKGIINKGSICPVIVEGTQEQISFAWNVGLGNCTGIGFGSLK